MSTDYNPWSEDERRLNMPQGYVQGMERMWDEEDRKGVRRAAFAVALLAVLYALDLI